MIHFPLIGKLIRQALPCNIIGSCILCIQKITRYIDYQYYHLYNYCFRYVYFTNEGNLLYYIYTILHEIAHINTLV